MYGMSAAELAGRFRAAGYKAEVRPGRTGRSDIVRLGSPTPSGIQEITVHRGGGVRGGPSVKLTGGGTYGTKKVVDGRNYNPAGEKNVNEYFDIWK
jgi:hypothetical protein